MEDKYIGRKLDGRYEIHELVGEGGMANVYKGVDLSDGRVVAVKILRDELNDNDELVRRFKNESRAISVLNHPNIVKVYDVSVNNKVQYIVMEYIEGITLKEYIEQRGEPLTYKETVHFVSQVLRALQHAHDKGIVHRDIKPQNIMLMENGNVKVMDFGIARLARSESHTATDQAIGSVHYISPEQAKGDKTDLRADIYSVGITMYEMLSGTLPFESDNAVSIAIKQISDEAVPLGEVNRSVPEGLVDITAKAMAKDPRRRYQSALEMLRDIEEFKRNPTIKFEYDYLSDNEPTRYMEKVSQNKQRRAAPAKAQPRRRKKSRRSILVPVVGIITLTIVIVCAIICINLFQNSGNPLFGEVKTIDLPNFVGMNVRDVETMLAQDTYRNLRVQEYDYEFNPDRPVGEVLLQNPTPKQVKENQKLTLTINHGGEMVVLPAELIGMNRSQASEKILEMGLRPYVVARVNADVPVGTVFDTEPKIGSEVQGGMDQQVTLYISSLKKDVERSVPSLLDLPSREEARAVLLQNSLDLGAVTEEHSDKPEGTVISQFPEAGSNVYINSTVNITISKGPEPPPEPVEVGVPNVVGMSPDAATAAMNAAGLNFEIVGHQFSNDAPEGTVAYQSATGVLPSGSTVYGNLSNGPNPNGGGGNNGGGDGGGNSSPPGGNTYPPPEGD